MAPLLRVVRGRHPRGERATRRRSAGSCRWRCGSTSSAWPRSGGRRRRTTWCRCWPTWGPPAHRPRIQRRGRQLSEQLSEAELAMFLIQLLVAGNETTRNLISGGLVALSERPDQWAALRADRSLIPGAVEELLRWTTPVISFMRTATAPTTIRGQTVAAGDPVLLVYASANRDEDGLRGRCRRAPHRPPSQSTRELRIRAPLLPRGGAGPAGGAGRARANCSTASSRWPRPGPVERTPSPVIAGVRHAPLVFG